MKYFRLAHMVNRHGSNITIKRREGTSGVDDDGYPVEPTETEVETVGIVSVFSDSELLFMESGSYDVDMIKLYTDVPLTRKDIVIYKGHEHIVSWWKNYDEHSDVFIYGIKRREK